MDYGYILKRAWAVTWKHKILWVFGIFVMAGGGANYSSSSSFNSSSGSPGGVTPEQLDQMERALEQVIAYLPILIGIGILMVLLAIVWWILSIAAQGALIHLVNEAEEGREVRAGAGWRMGFRYWWRLFGIYFLLFLPVMVIGLLMGLAIFFSVIAGSGVGSETPEAVFSTVLSICGIVIFGVLLLVVIGFIVGLLALLATRHAVLRDARVVESIRFAWTDVRTRFKDVFLMWLINFGIGIAWGMAVGIVSIFFGIGIFVSILTGVWPIAGLLGILMFLLLLIPNAIYSVFLSAMWTVFYRRLTGMDVPPKREASPVSAGPVYREPASTSEPGAAPGAPAPPPATPGVPPPPATPDQGGGLPPSPSGQSG
jgi:hypothetical protein